MTPIEKAIRDFCGHHADWWPSTTQVQEMLALAQPCPTCEALARTVMLDQTSHDTTAPQIKVGCAECGVNGNHALYCVACAENYLKDKNNNAKT